MVDHISEETLFRYLVVSAVNALLVQGVSRSVAVRAVAEQEHVCGTRLRQVSERTVWRWFKAWRKHGLDGLKRTPRSRVEDSVVLPEKFLSYLRKERKEDRDASVPELIRRARDKGELHADGHVDRVTVWRAMVRMGLPTRQTSMEETGDMRRFAFGERMQLVMLDFKHFRAGPQRLKRVAIYLLDDATRYGLGVIVATSEQTIVVIRILAQTLRQYGFMSLLYWDLGSAFRGEDLLVICAQLDIGVIYGRAQYPQARGKIERFNRSAKARILRALAGSNIDPDCAALTLLLRHDLDLYNQLSHESLDNATPAQCFFGSTRPLRPITSEAWLVEHFTLRFSRRVSNDHVIPFRGEFYEVPRGLAGKRIDVLRRPLENDALYVNHEGRLIRLHVVDPTANAHSRRAHPVSPGLKTENVTPPAPTASMLSFQHRYQSLLGPDGGFPDTNKENKDHE